LECRRGRLEKALDKKIVYKSAPKYHNAQKIAQSILMTSVPDFSTSRSSNLLNIKLIASSPFPTFFVPCL
jgi:hypothetical protein